MSGKQRPTRVKTTNITIRMNPITKKKWQSFAKLNSQDLTEFLTILADWACSKPDAYKEILHRER